MASRVASFRRFCVKEPVIQALSTRNSFVLPTNSVRRHFSTDQIKQQSSQSAQTASQPAAQSESKPSWGAFLFTAAIGVGGFGFGMSGIWDRQIPAECQKRTEERTEENRTEERTEENESVNFDTSETFFAERNADQLQVFSGTSNPGLAREICSHLGVPLGRVRIGRFADGEVTLEILDEVRGQDVFVVQSAPSASSNNSPQSSLMELCFLIAALKRASAKRVTAVLPYVSYFRQTVQTDQSKPLAAADLGRILVTMGVDRVVFVDVHTKRAEGLFPEIIPITNLQPQSLAIEYFKRKPDISRSVTVVSTDNTGTEKAEAFMSRMQKAGFDASMATLVSNRPERPQKEEGAIVVHPKVDVSVITSQSKSSSPPMNSTHPQDWLVGDVNGKDCIIVDDIIDTGERAVNTACALKSAGARRIYMFATHGLFSRGAIDRIVKSPIKEVVVTDTVAIPENLYCEKLRVISVSMLVAEAIRRIHRKLPLWTLHRDVLFDNKLVEDVYHR